MNIRELLTKLSIRPSDEYKIDRDGSSWVIRIIDSDHFGVIYSKLQKLDFVEEDMDEGKITNNINLKYFNDSLHIELNGDFDEDKYQMKISEE